MNSNKRNVIATLILWGAFINSFYISPSLAATPDDDSQYSDCISAHTDNMSWGGCGEVELRRLETKLTTVYSRASELVKDKYQVSKSVDKDHEPFFSATNTPELLQAEQEAWQIYESKACEYYGSPDWGREKNVLNYPMCKAGIIKQRIRELNNIIEILSH